MNYKPVNNNTPTMTSDNVSERDKTLLLNIGIYGLENGTTKPSVGAAICNKGNILSRGASDANRSLFSGIVFGLSGHAEIGAISAFSLKSKRRMKNATNISRISIKSIMDSSDDRMSISVNVKFEADKLFKNHTMYIARVGIDETTGEITFKNAMPCVVCAQFMYSLGFRKLCYTTNDGCIKINMRDFIEKKLYASRGTWNVFSTN